MVIAPARMRLRINLALTPVMTVRSPFFWMRLVVAFLTECPAIRYIVLELWVFVPVFDVVRSGCPNRQAVLIQPAVPPALLAQISSPPKHFLSPCLVARRTVVFVIWHLLHLSRL